MKPARRLLVFTAVLCMAAMFSLAGCSTTSSTKAIAKPSHAAAAANDFPTAAQAGIPPATLKK